MECILHYHNLTKYTLKEVSEINIERIRLAKEKRLRLGGQNHHSQCDQIPDIITPNTHKIHVECYKTFTSIIGNQKYKEDKVPDLRHSERLQSPIPSPSSIAWVYPKECNLCLKYRTQYRNKKYEPYTISTYAAEETVKAAAKDKNEKLFKEIQHLDLISKEFKVHKHCYQQFTSGYALAARSSEDNIGESSSGEANCYDRGKLEEARTFVEDEVIRLGKAVSMNTIHKIYDLGVGDSRYRSKLKLWLQKQFKDRISFVTPKTKSSDIVIPTSCLDSSALNYNRTKTIQVAASYLKEDILKKYRNLQGIEWPPSVKELSHPDRAPVTTLYTFLETIILQEDHHSSPSPNLIRLVDSIAQDITAAVTRGKNIQCKQFLLGQGLHNLTGSRKVIDILHKLGHSISYNMVCEIETAQAECTLKAARTSTILPLKPTLPEQTVFTHFWVDNFDLKVDRIGGGGSINTTHLMAFQEQQPHCELATNTITIPRKKSRRLFYEDITLEIKPVDVYIEPKQITSSESSYSRDKENHFNKWHVIWLYARKQNQFNQVVPAFKGWHLQQRSGNSVTVSKTIETYLPPFTSKVTEFSTIQKYLTYLQGLAANVNMPYVNVTLDVGAAINAFKTIWSIPHQYKNVMIHLGSFHFLKENFQILGSLISGSGFDDVIYQSGLCTSGSLQGAMAGSHYNRAWALHSVFSEALERLLMTRFLVEKKPRLPTSLTNYGVETDSSANDALDQSTKFFQEYERYRAEVESGYIGKTAQYWMIYMNLMRMQLLGLSAVHQNDLDLLICAWKAFIPLYFAMNKVNYARYGSYYVYTLLNIDKMYPGMREYLKIGGISAQAQTNHAVRTATDQRGEQTINKDAKTSGGVKAFASCDASVLKWCLNRPHQAKNFLELKKLAGIDSSTECYKPMRPSAITDSEIKVTKVIEVLENEYINPFSPSLNESQLYNLSSGIPKNNGTDELLNIIESGKLVADEFFAKRILTTEKLFRDPISRVQIPSFHETTVKIKKGGPERVVHANRDILSKLLSLSAKFEKPIDFQHAFKFPLYPYPLSMSFPDGSKRETSKSQLLKEIVPDIPDKSLAELGVVKEQCGYVIDMIAQLRVCLIPVPETFEQLTLKFLQSFPKGYARYDIVADTYRAASIKSAERRKRGNASKILIGSIKSKVPRDMNRFMLNDENKTSLVKLIFQFITDQNCDVLRLLGTEQIVLSGDDECHTVISNAVLENHDLKSNQEEADTKVILHSINIISNNLKVVLRSPSGDTDIMVLALAIINDLDKVFIDYGNGKARKRLLLSDIKLKESEKNALVGFHSFTGNDYIPALFRKGKKRCWSILNSEESFMQVFCEIGNSWEVTEQQVADIEKYVCALYLSKKSSVNELRYDLFLKKQKKENKIVDLSTIPPCFSSLYLQIKRANYVCKVWKSTETAQLILPNIEEHGWCADGTIAWITEPYPDDVSDLLIDTDNVESELESGDSDAVYESDVESEYE